MEINFYGVRQDDIQKVVAILLEKSYQSGKNSSLLVSTKEEADFLNAKLWSVASWLPHCLQGEKREEDHPVVIYINNEEEIIDIKNNANFLFVFGSAKHYDLEKFEKIYIVFDLKNEFSVKNNRARWKDLLQQDHTMCFYKQNEKGKFEETKL